MKKWLQLSLKMIKVFILFTACTILFYYGIIWINEEYEGYRRYDEPKGSAIKVTSQTSDINSSLFDRLILFYLIGE